MRSFALAILLLGLALSASAVRKGWTPERRNLQTRTCIDAYWDVHPEITPTPAVNHQVVDYCACVTDDLSDRVDYDDVVKGREVFVVIADICRMRVGLR